MARLPFSLVKQGIKEYEVKDTQARRDINNITKSHTLGASVDVSSYTSAGNRYTAPEDGYLYVNAGSTTAVHIYSENTLRMQHEQRSVSGQAIFIVLFIKKGLSFYITNTATNSTFNPVV